MTVLRWLTKWAIIRVRMWVGAGRREVERHFRIVKCLSLKGGSLYSDICRDPKGRNWRKLCDWLKHKLRWKEWFFFDYPPFNHPLSLDMVSKSTLQDKAKTNSATWSSNIGGNKTCRTRSSARSWWWQLLSNDVTKYVTRIISLLSESHRSIAF